MKFDSELYELTKEISKEKIEYTKEELEFARLILSEFYEKAKEEKPKDGLITVTFKDRWWSTTDMGYHEIYELVRLKKFNTLFRHYNIYVQDSSSIQDEGHDAYFELIWDYRTYTDSLKNSEMQEKIERYEKEKKYNEYKTNKEEVAKIEEDIKRLQRKLDTLKK